jgi:O-antigen/teichoic acid export membrane protein
MALFGRAYSANWPVVLPVLLWAGLGAITGSASTALLAYGKVAYFFWQQTGYAATTVVFALCLRPFGAIGLAAALSLAVTITAAANYLVLSRKVGIYTARARSTYKESCLGVFAACAGAWVLPTEWRSVLAIPITGLVGVFSVASWSDASERGAFIIWLKRAARLQRVRSTAAP